MLAFLATMSALVETETAIADFWLAELAALRLRLATANRRTAELRQIIETSMKEGQRASKARATIFTLCTIRRCRERVETALAEVETLGDEFQAIEHSVQCLYASQALAKVFPLVMADA
jgi:hypothetical protein